MVLFSLLTRRIFLSICCETLMFSWSFFLQILVGFLVRFPLLCAYALEASEKCGAEGKCLEVVLTSKAGIFWCCSILKGSGYIAVGCLPLLPDHPAVCALGQAGLCVPAAQWISVGCFHQSELERPQGCSSLCFELICPLQSAGG